MRILAVDDDALARMAMRGMITALGHECVVAPDGASAWAILQTEPVNVVISDRMMPDMDGLELCRKIRAAGPEQDYVYVVLASALGEDEDAYDGMAAGADEYLTKPLRLAQLERKLIAAERVTTMHRQLGRLRAALGTANQAQADMIAMLAHDTRQPLTAVIGYSEANLEDWETNSIDTKRALVAKVAGAARRLDQLIEDILTMANLKSGTVSTKPESLVAIEVIREVVEAASEAASEAARITVEGDSLARATVDPWHFRQILTNLTGNAIKYGAAPISVTVKMAGEDVTVQVVDHGEGVPPEFVPHLFERFSRADTGVALRKSGTGFGLYIVQSLAEANGGRITYSPGREGGSCFTLHLPAG